MGKTITFRFKDTPEDQAFATNLIRGLAGLPTNTDERPTKKITGKFSPGDKIKGLQKHKQKTGVVLESHSISSKIIWDGGMRSSWVSNRYLELCE